MDAPFPEGMMDDIRAFFKAEAGTPRGDDLYPAVFDTRYFFPLQRQAELAWMMRKARQCEPKVVYEIGADKGGGFYHWVKCLPTVRAAAACEIRGLPYAPEFAAAFPDVDFFWQPGSSFDRANVNGLKNWLDGRKIDCLFIDGCKANFLTDFEAHLDLMADGGVVFMHDVNDRPPFEAFKAVQRKYAFNCERYIDVSDYEAAAAREAAGTPCAGNHEGWLRYWRGASCGVGAIYLS
jgi:hypothetical protein